MSEPKLRAISLLAFGAAAIWAIMMRSGSALVVVGIIMATISALALLRDKASQFPTLAKPWQTRLRSVLYHDRVYAVALILGANVLQGLGTIMSSSG